MKLYQIPLYNKIHENCNPVNEIGIETYGSAFLKNNTKHNIQLDRQHTFTQSAIDEFNEKYGTDTDNLKIYVNLEKNRKILDYARLVIVYKYKPEFLEKIGIKGYESYPKYKRLTSPTIDSKSNLWDFDDDINSKYSGSMPKPDALLTFVKELTIQELKRVEIAVVAFKKYQEDYKKYKEELPKKEEIPDWMKN